MSGSREPAPLAFLPMYALPEMAAENEAVWASLAAALLAEGVPPAALPARLSAPPAALPEEIAPETVFSQMCGYPLRTMYDGQYRLLGTPLYDLPGCALGREAEAVPEHRSFLVIRAEAPGRVLGDLRGLRFAMNGRDSNSGMNLPRRLFAPLAGARPFFATVLISGSHLRSMEMVAEGAADVAAIDCVTHGFIALYRPTLAARLRIVGETPPAPAIPFITAAATPADLAARMGRLLAAPPPALAAALAGLRIARILPPRLNAYEVVLRYEAEAANLGYPMLS